MAEVKVPELAESITEGTVAEWLKNIGDNVEKGEAILELETDKVNVEVVSEEDGILQEQLASEGDTVEVGQAIAIVGEGKGSTSSSSESQNNDSNSENENTKTDSSETNYSTPRTSTEAQGSDTSSNDDSESINNKRVNATPSARRHARKNGIDLNEVAGKGSDVIRKEDVDNSQKPSQSNQNTQPNSQQETSKKSTANTPNKPVIREKMSRRKKTAAKKLLEVSNNTAMLTTFNEAVSYTHLRAHET